MTKMTKNLVMQLRWALLLPLLLSVTVRTSAQSVEQLLERFDAKPDVATANAFFQQLLDAEFLDEPYVLPDDAPLDTLRAQVWYWAAEWMYDTGQHYDLAVDYGKRALPLCQAGKDDILTSDCLNILALSYVRLTDYDAAANYARQCFLLDEKSGDTGRISSSLNTLAGIYMAGGQPQEAEQYILKGITLAEQDDNPVRLAVLQGMASEVYHALGNDDEALSRIDRAIELDQQTGRTDRLPVRQTQRASVLIGLHRYAEAEEALKPAVDFFRQVGDDHSLGIALNKMGMAVLCQERPQEALPYYREAADIFVRLGDPYNEVHARRGLYETQWQTDPAAAKAALDRFDFLKDSIYSHTSADRLARYNAEFGNDWLKVENHAERAARQRAVWLGIGAALLLAALAAGIWWVMRRRHLRQKQINVELSSNIEQLREQYKQLHVSYDKAMLTRRMEDDEQMTDADRTFLEHAVSIVNELTANGQIDAAALAERLNMSPFQLRQRITAITGETPQSFIQVLRMRRARHLLANHPELNITEVANLCAYNDTPNFTRAFKKMFGMTPSQYVEKDALPVPEGSEE